MKSKLLFLTLLFLSAKFSDSQNWTSLYDFDAVNQQPVTILYADSIWQIGKPQKMFIDSAYSDTLCLVTDTLNFYSINDSSSILLGFPFYFYGFDLIRIEYKQIFDTDTLADFGKLEFATSVTGPWLDISVPQSNSMIYGGWTDTVNIFHPSGKSNGWIDYKVNISADGVYFNCGIDYKDSCYLRFTFISDSIDNNREGWAIDNIVLKWYHMEAVSDIVNKLRESFCFPNPVTNHLYFANNLFLYGEQIPVFNAVGRIVSKKFINQDNSLDVSDLESGVYYLKSKYSFIRFIKL